MAENPFEGKEITPLPNGLYLLRDGDRFTILYPSGVLEEVGVTLRNRLAAAKSKHASDLDEIKRMSVLLAGREEELRHLREELAAYARQQSALLARKRKRAR